MFTAIGLLAWLLGFAPTPFVTGTIFPNHPVVEHCSPAHACITPIRPVVPPSNSATK